MFGETTGSIQEDSRGSQEEVKRDGSDTQKANFDHIHESANLIE